jgi:hypothetical protein
LKQPCIHRVVTDNGACYRSGEFARIVGDRTRHQKTKPYTPRHNGKVERYQRIVSEEILYAHEFTSEDDRAAAISVWNIHYNHHRPHSGAGGLPPASRLESGVTNVQPSYTYWRTYRSMDQITVARAATVAAITLMTAVKTAIRASAERDSRSLRSGSSD